MSPTSAAVSVWPTSLPSSSISPSFVILGGVCVRLRWSGSALALKSASEGTGYGNNSQLVTYIKIVVSSCSPLLVPWAFGCRSWSLLSLWLDHRALRSLRPWLRVKDCWLVHLRMRVWFLLTRHVRLTSLGVNGSHLGAFRRFGIGSSGNKFETGNWDVVVEKKGCSVSVHFILVQIGPMPHIPWRQNDITRQTMRHGPGQVGENNARFLNSGPLKEARARSWYSCCKDNPQRKAEEIRPWELAQD